MKIFVALSLSRDHETHVVGVAACRTEARQLVEQFRNEGLSFSPYSTDAVAALDDDRGDMVGQILAFDVPEKETELSRLRAFAKSMLNPEEMGWSISKHVRDAARAALGRNPVETKGNP